MKVNIDTPIEGEFVEFKTSLSELDKGIEALTAMLNKHQRGAVYFGVDNQGEVIGLKGQIGQETIKKIEMRVGEIVKPAIVPSIVIENYDDKKAIILSAKGNRKPYSSSGDYRIRVGSSNKKIDPELLGELFFDSDSSSLESIECIDQNLTFDTLRYLYHENGLSVNEDNFYTNVGLLTNGKFNKLAELLADNNGTSIKVVRFATVDKSEMVSRNEYGYRCLFVAMRQVNEYILSLNETRVDVASSLQRKEVPLFNSHAFEEAWTNACAHNKWIRNVPPAVYIYSDRIEIISTGGLPFGYTEDDFYHGISHPVNKGLFKIMGQLRLIEQTGHGNLAVLAAYGKEAFTINENYIMVTIPFSFVPSMQQLDVNGLTATEKKVLFAIKNNPQFTTKELASFCSLGTTRIGEIVKILKDRRIIKRVGGNKNGHWEVL